MALNKSMRCKNNYDEIQNVTWLYIKKAWLPAATVCLQKIYSSVRTSVIPTVTTDAVDGLYSLNMHADGTVVSEGSSPVLEYGWVWSYSTGPTISDNKVIAGSNSYVGSFEASSSPGSMDVGPTVYVRAYATSAVGTGYGNELTGTAFSCFVKDTLITLANGVQKPIQDITYDDSLVVGNFDEGKFDEAKPIWICQPFVLPNYRLMKFNNGRELSVASFKEGHRIYNIQNKSFTNLNTPATPFGTKTLCDNGEIAILVGDELVENNAWFYNIITNKHINMFANSILTSCKLNNIYPISSDMKFIKNNRKLRDISEFEEVSEEVFEGLRLAEQPDYTGLKEKAKIISKNFVSC